MGPVKVGAKIIAEEGHNAAGIEVDDQKIGPARVGVEFHQTGERAFVTVSNDISSESKYLRPGDTRAINGVDVEHSG